MLRFVTVFLLLPFNFPAFSLLSFPLSIPPPKTPPGFRPIWRDNRLPLGRPSRPPNSEDGFTFSPRTRNTDGQHVRPRDALQQHCGCTLFSFRLISQCQPRNTGTTLRFQSLAMYLLFFWDIQQFQLTWHYPIQITDIDDVRPMRRWCTESSLREFVILGRGTHESTLPINDCLNFLAETYPKLEYLENERVWRCFARCQY